jgi:hypothetical protein
VAVRHVEHTAQSARKEVERHGAPRQVQRRSRREMKYCDTHPV